MSIQRYDKLDSLRGLAALSVFLFHAFNVFWIRDESSTWAIISKTPLKILWGGHEAVILFFILSGFVLSLPYFSSKQNNYPTFAIKRFFRIYIPYIFAVLFSILARIWFMNEGEIAGVWNGEINLGLITNHIFMIGTYNTLAFDPVIWSLIHEFRISLIFPLLMYFMVKYDWKKILTVGLVISIVSIGFTSYYDERVDLLSSPIISFHYVLMFIVGAILAKHREDLVTKINSQKFKTHIFLLLIGAFLYSYAINISANTIGYFVDVTIVEFVADWLITIGGSIFILIAISSSKLFSFLNKRPLLHIGKLSYSFYLYHLPVLLIVYSLVGYSIPIWISIVTSLILSFIISQLGYHYIEQPSIILSKRTTFSRNKNYAKKLKLNNNN